MSKIVYNACYGGFGLSEAGMRRYKEITKAAENDKTYDHNIKRDDPALVQVVEELGDAANSGFAKLKIAEIPAGSRYRIDEYDGYESVETPDSYEWEVAR